VVSLAALGAGFAVTALSELGDKTQLAVVSLASRHPRRAVFLGAVTAEFRDTGVDHWNQLPFDVPDGLRAGERDEVRVGALVPRELERLADDGAQPFVGEIVAGGDADLLIDDRAHADVHVLLLHVLVDVVVGEARERAVRREDEHLGLLRLAHREGLVAEVLVFLFAQHWLCLLRNVRPIVADVLEPHAFVDRLPFR